MSKSNTSKIKYSVYLKQTKNSVSPVILNLSYGYKIIDPINKKTKYKPLVYDTGVKLKESDWDNEKKQPLKTKDKAAVQRIIESAINTYNYLANQFDSLPPKKLKEELDILLGRKEIKIESVTITDFIQKFIIERNQNLNDKTKSSYKVLKGKIESFQTAKKITLTTANLDKTVYLDFQKYIKGIHEKNNSVWGIMKNLKSTLNKLRSEFPHIAVFNPTKELSSDQKVKLVYEKKVYFEFDKIQQIIEHTPSSDKLKNVRLILLTLIFSGCRYSDVNFIKPRKSYEDEYVSFNYAHFITTKGEGVEVVIPILKPLQEAIDKHGEPPYPISEQKFNEYVKDLCLEIGFTEETKLSYTKSDGGKKFETKQFYQFVSSHIGRRTFITHLIDAVPVTLLSKVTGHTLSVDKDVIYKYDKKSALQSTVLFVKELKRVCKDRKEDFPIQLA